MTTTLLVALGAPVVLVLLAVALILVRTACGTCAAHARYAWLHTTGPADGTRFPATVTAPVS
jgi:hypothetical protein